MVKLIERITTAVKNTLGSFLPDIKEALLNIVLEHSTGGTPDDQVKLTSKIGGMAVEIFQPDKASIIGAQAGSDKSAIAESVRVQDALADSGAKNLIISSAAGAATEIATVGQVESMGRIFTDMYQQWGYPIVMRGSFNTPYKWGVDIRHNYYWANQFKPMIPPAPDIINMVVREAFDPELSKQLISRFPTPTDFTKWIGYLGFSKEWADKYWMAHFIPMPISQAERALHRGFIDKGEFSNFLRIADYNPLWHDLMTKVAYRTWRIRDMRIGWELGILDDTKLKKRLTDYGYNPDDTEDIMNVMKAYALAAETGEVRREIISDFTNGFISESTLKENIKALGTPDSVAEFYVQKAVMRRTRDLKKLQSDTVLDSFKKGIIGQADAEGKLRELGLGDDWVTANIDNVIANVGVSGDQVTSLTTAQALRAYKLRIIEESEVRDRLTLKGFPERDIDILIQINKPIIEEEGE